MQISNFSSIKFVSSKKSEKTAGYNKGQAGCGLANCLFSFVGVSLFRLNLIEQTICISLNI